MTDVARRAHVSARTVYLHSSSKERLVEQALRRRAAALISRVERWRPRGDTPVRILDEMLPRVFDRGFVGALAPEIMRQIERANDLIEELCVTFGRFGHGLDDRNKIVTTLSYSSRPSS